MSKDIRSFFTVLSSKTSSGGWSVTSSKTTPSKSSSQKRARKDEDDDVIPNTPDDQKPNKNEQSKRRRIVQISSDSETENDKPKPPKRKTTPKKTLKKSPATKPSKNKLNVETVKKKINPFEAFGNAPIKQDIIKKPELNIHDDDDFDKTLMDLDEDELFQQSESTSSTTKQESSKTTQKNKTEIKKTPPTHEKKESRQSILSISSDDGTPKKPKNEAKTKKTPDKQQEKTEIKKTPKREKKESISSEDNTPKKPKTPGKQKQTSAKKRALSDEDNTITDEDRYEKKRYSAMLYQKYLSRGGPANPGAKWVPKGKPDCLKGLCFIITGVLESMEREEAQNLIVEHGGRCTQSVSGKVNYMVLGEDAGPSKVEKARKLGTKMISEDDLIDLICIKSGIQNQNKKEPSSDKQLSQTSTNSSELFTDESKPKTQKTDTKKHKTVAEKISKEMERRIEESKKEKTPEKIKKETISDDEDEIPSTTVRPQKEQIKQELKPVKKEIIKPKPMPKLKKEEDINNLAWVDKYKPKDISQIIGQQGPGSNMNRLIRWLQDWYKYRRNEAQGNPPPRPTPWTKNDNGAFFRCALLSGPPGVGKSTTAALVCQHLGLDVVEFNASDTRNKRVVQQEVLQLVSSTSIAGFANHGGSTTRKHVLIMDEVDGMSGNEDRGGVQELISIIKKTQIPIICLCNDRQHPKIRSLANYCFDLRFSKPKVEQIRGAMMSILYKEKLQLKPNAVAEVIMGTMQDVRQTLNQLSLIAAGQSVKNPQSTDAANVAKEAKRMEKDYKLGSWDVVRKVFSEEEAKSMSFMDHSKLFFFDYSINPLFIQENYLKVVPHAPKAKHLQLFAKAADAISVGEIVDNVIRSKQQWGLLDVQAVFSSVAPGQLLRGHMGGQIDFPQWLGKNSKYSKNMRLAGEINSHTRISTTASKTSLILDQAKVLRNVIAQPLLKNGTGGIPEALDIMKNYNLLREDITSLVELTNWPNQKDPFSKIDAKIKSAFSRAYNKEMPALPYAVPALSKKKAATNDEYGDEDDIQESDDDNEDDINADSMIKIKKPKTASSKPSSRGKATTGKARAKKTK